MFDFNHYDKSKKVFVAMSGGVDSSVVAAMVHEAGFETIGVTMCFSITHPDSKKPSCCGVDGIQDAKRAAQLIGIPHYVMDFAKDINDYIIDDFVSEYLNGRTPNPCARCNQHLKFGTLYDKIKQLGGGYLATGHYSKIEFNPDSKRYELKKAIDHRKDQSYFLAPMNQKTLSEVMFPLGGVEKVEVRALAEKYKLNVADKAESQDICFVPDAGYKAFIRQRVGDEVFIPGKFINEEGKEVGEHKGIANYTIGQREGLGIALGKPMYVNHINKEDNTVHIGPQELLYSSGLIASQFNPVSMDIPQEKILVDVRIRYNAPQVKGHLTCLENGRVQVDFVEPQKSVTPGQSAVFYQDDIVLGGATIEKPIAYHPSEIN